MKAYLIPGVMGLLLGLLLRWTGLFRADNLRLALGLRRGRGDWFDPLRSALTALGYAMALTAFLCWLAVIDVDDIAVLPLSLGALLGGGVLGIAAGLCGFTPMTAFAGLGAGNALEALCVLAGCFAGSFLLRPLDGLLAPLRSAAPYANATLFRMTLNDPWLLSGGFLGQACAGLLLVVIALCIPSRKPVILTDAEVEARAAEAEEIAEASTPEDESAPVEDEPAPAEDEPAPAEESPDPEQTGADTFVALLEGEEPLVVDTDAPGDEMEAVMAASAPKEPSKEDDKDDD